MDRLTNDLAKQLPRLEAELEAWKQERHALDVRIAVRQRLITALKDEIAFKSPRGAGALTAVRSNGALSPAASTGEKVLAILREVGKPMRATEVLEALQERNLAPDVADPQASVGSALWYLARKADLVERQGTHKKRTWVAKDARLEEASEK